MIEILGWIGSLFFALCGIPQARLCYQQGHAKGIDPLFIWFWVAGEVSYMIYIPLAIGLSWPLITNLIFNFVCCVIILRYIYVPRKI